MLKCITNYILFSHVLGKTLMLLEIKFNILYQSVRMSTEKIQFIEISGNTTHEHLSFQMDFLLFVEDAEKLTCMFLEAYEFSASWWTETNRIFCINSEKIL